MKWHLISNTLSLLSFSLVTNNAPLHTMTNYLERIASNERVGRKDNISISILKNSRKRRKKDEYCWKNGCHYFYCNTTQESFSPTRPFFFSSYFSQKEVISLVLTQSLKRHDVYGQKIWLFRFPTGVVLYTFCV